jgi:hypothetical protein
MIRRRQWSRDREEIQQQQQMKIRTRRLMMMFCTPDIMEEIAREQIGMSEIF